MSAALFLILMAQFLVTPSYAEDDIAVTDVISDETSEEVTGDDESSEESDLEEELDAAEDLADEVEDDNVVEVLEDAEEELQSEEALEEFLEEATDEILDDLEGESDEEVGERLKAIQARIDNKLKELEAELKRNRENPRKVLEIKKKMLRLKALKNKLRAKVLRTHKQVKDKVRKVKRYRNLYEVRWGELTKRPDCAALQLNRVKDALEEGDVLPGCEAEKVEYEGRLEVDRGEAHVRKRVLFEKNDAVIQEGGAAITFTSVIAGHWDGLIVEYNPKNTSDEAGPVELTVTLGDFKATLSGDDIFGRHDIGNGHTLEIKKLHQAISGVTDRKMERLINKKLEVSDKLTKVEEKVHRLRLLNTHADEADELDALVDEIGQYNFDDQSAEEIEGELELVLNNLDEEAGDELVEGKVKRLKERLGKIKQVSRQRKFSQKLIPFKDTDDNEWYTNFVSKVKERGIISGYKDSAGNELGEFRPGNNITVAEILKISLEASEQGESVNVPRLRAALNHWAKGYVSKAEELGLDIVEGEVDLNRPATRAEVVRLMLEALDIEPDRVSRTDFSDVSGSHEHAAFIQHAKELDIVSGDAGKTTFRPNEPVNRAEASKIANQLIEILLGE